MSLRFFIGGVGAQKCSLNQSPSVILLLSRIHRYFSCLHLLPDRTVEVRMIYSKLIRWCWFSVCITQLPIPSAIVIMVR